MHFPGDEDAQHMAAAAAGGGIVQFLIDNQSTVFNGMRYDLTQKQNLLAAKCSRIRQLQEDLSTGSINTVFVEAVDEVHQAAIRELWELLQAAERVLSFSPVAKSDPTEGAQIPTC